MMSKNLIRLAKPVRGIIFAKVFIMAVKFALFVIITVLLVDLVFYATGAVSVEHGIFHRFILIGGLVIARMILNLIEGTISANIGSSIRIELRDDVFARLLNLELDYQKFTDSASLITTSVEGVESLQVYYEKFLPQLFYSIIAPVFLFIYISFIYFPAAIVLFIIVPLIPMSIVLFMKRAERKTAGFWENYERLGNFFLDSLRGLKTLILNGHDEERSGKLHNMSWKFRNATMDLLKTQLTSIIFMDTFAYIGATAGILVAIWGYSHNAMTLREGILILLLSIEFFLPLRLVGSYFHAAMNGMTASEEIAKFLSANAQFKEQQPENSASGNGSIPADQHTVCSFKDVGFSYTENQTLFEKLNFEMKSDEMLAIVGDSGSGKSTIASLLTRFNSPASGKIFLNGKPIEQFSLQHLRETVSYIPHDSYLFSGTIRENLSMSNENATDEELLTACRKAGFEDFILRSENGLDTVLSEGGSNLSGGERQRLAIARSVLKGSQLYIFDESTSNLDSDNEALILDTIRSIAEEKPVLMISHRLNAIRNAQCIICIKSGRIVEKGTADELIAQKGEFYRLFYDQLVVDQGEK